MDLITKQTRDEVPYTETTTTTTTKELYRVLRRKSVVFTFIAPTLGAIIITYICYYYRTARIGSMPPPVDPTSSTAPPSWRENITSRQDLNSIVTKVLSGLIFALLIVCCPCYDLAKPIAQAIAQAIETVAQAIATLVQAIARLLDAGTERLANRRSASQSPSTRPPATPEADSPPATSHHL
jgi:hypothetical protein